MKHTLPLAALAAAVASLSFADEAAPAAAEAVAPAPGTIRMITEPTTTRSRGILTAISHDSCTS